METGENKKYYEWNSTSRAGSVEVYLAEDENKIYFESGRFVPKDQIDYLLRQIEELIYNEKARYQQEEKNTSAIDNNTDWNAILGNDPTLLNQLNNETPVLNEPVVQVQQPVAEQNPIKIILDKQRKKEKITLLVDFEIEVPSHKVLDLLDVMFDREEVIEEIIKSSTEKINTQLVTDRLAESIKLKVESLFSGEEKDDLKNEMPIS